MANIKQIPLYFDNIKKQHITTENDLVCFDCNQLVNNVFFYYWSWGKVFSSNKILCMSCINKQRTITETDEIYTVTVVDEITPGAVPVFIKLVRLGSRGNETVFSMAAKNREGEVVVDNTVLAGRIDYEHKAQVEQRIAERELELNNKNINNTEDFDDLMLDLQKSKLYEEPKQLSALEEQDLLLGKRIEDKSNKDDKD